MLKRTFIVLIFTAALLVGCGLASSTVLAASGVTGGLTTACTQDPSNPLCKEKTQDNTKDPLSKTIGTITTFAATIGGIVAVFFVIYGGFRYVTSNGDSTKTAAARNTIFYAVIGVVIIVVAQVIILFVINHLG